MRRAGFSTMEMLVVIGIIAVLMAILIPVVSGARQRADVATCTVNMQRIGLALAAYRQDNGVYPAPENVMGDLAKASPKSLSTLPTCPRDPEKGHDTYSAHYNYYGYEEIGTPIPLTDLTAAGVQYATYPNHVWNTAKNIPDSAFPGLINPTPPANTIITTCGFHAANHNNYLILRLAGEVQFLAPTLNDTQFWALSKGM